MAFSVMFKRRYIFENAVCSMAYGRCLTTGFVPRTHTSLLTAATLEELLVYFIPSLIMSKHCSLKLVYFLLTLTTTRNGTRGGDWLTDRITKKKASHH